MGSFGEPSESKEPPPHGEPLSTPPVMWPESGSGFEADPFSSADMSQEKWTVPRRRPHNPVIRWILRIVAIALALAFIAAQVVH